MKVIQLEAENLLKIKAISIKPDSNLVFIEGRNAQGKSTTVDSIWYAVGGKEAQKDTRVPIRDGAESAKVVVELGDDEESYITVTRTWTKNGSYLKVEDADGIVKSPQALMDKLVGRLAFNPQEFMGMNEAEQAKVLLGIIGVDLEAIEQERARAFSARTEVNREVKKLETRLADLSEPGPDVPEKEISTIDIMQEYQHAKDTLEANIRKRQELEYLRSDYEEKESEIARLEEALVQAKAELKSIAQRGQIMHKPKGNTKAIPTHFYGVYHLVNGGYDFVVWTNDDVRDHAARFSQNSSSGPWKTDYVAMGRKTLLIQILNYAPRAVEFAKATAMDGTVKTVDEQIMGQNGYVDMAEIEPIEAEYIMAGPPPEPEPPASPPSDRGQQQAMKPPAVVPLYVNRIKPKNGEASGSVPF